MTKVHPIFNTAYKGLNNAQKQAVDAINGPVMVVAGPGTGKTHILALRIANILTQTDTPPDGILALTFTEAGVDAMKQRLLKLIGPTAYKVKIYTFHGFCNDIIHSHPEYFPRIISSKALTDIESIIYIREAIESLPLEKLKPFGDPYFYVQTARSAISTLKREHKVPAEVLAKTQELIEKLEKDPESFHEKGAHKGKMKGAVQTQIDRLKKERELGLVFEWYEAKLTEKKKFDFEDMIGEVVRALQTDSEFLLVVQEKYLYILADEHQDANGAQNTLLELLTSYDPSPNLFIVGDEKQAIFRFQGASLDSFAYFHEKFPTAKLIPLVDSYRSGSVLLDAAHSLMRESIPAERHPWLLSKLAEPHLAVLEERTFTSEEMEIAWVAQNIQERISEGVSPGDIAIIYRTNADALPISRALSHLGILHTLDSKSNIFTNHAIMQLVTYLRLCTHIGSDELLAHVLHFSWVGIDARDTYKVLIYAQKKRLPYLEVISSKDHLKEAKVYHAEKAHEVAQTVQRLAKIAQEESARDFFDHVLHESGLLTHVLSRPDSITILNAIRGLANTLETLSSTQALYTGRDFVRDLGLYEEYGIEIEPDTQPKERTNAVHLVTAHRSKGLEYEYVYIIHARDGKWGNRTSRNTLPLSTLAAVPDTDTEDERRLFYVALTRAKLYVSVSYGVTSSARSKESTIAQFMMEIDPALIARVDTGAFEATVAPEAMFAMKPAAEHSLSDQQFLIDAFVEQGLSATALNNYLDCPWKYFYRNLVRIPEKPTPSSLYGNALHNALRLFRDMCASSQQYQPLSLLLEYLQVSIDQQGFTPTSYADAQKKGTRALTDWYERNKADYQFRVLCEKKFEVYMPLSGGAPVQVLLRGLIDVIEFNIDGSVHVIDYKTGKHKSRNELEGGTKNATGDYKRQLDFYCILLELGQMERPARLTLEFIEPDAKGNTAVHTFLYDADMVKALKETIERVAGEIYTLAFWDKKCDTEDCEYCTLRGLMI
ncbi:ATP-dependent helicase [Candidatus Kaiserbacteria bacterium]|nr:ATP-dependent helicase [Candidatus Kaiserbacteria bacterium]